MKNGGGYNGKQKADDQLIQKQPEPFPESRTKVDVDKISKKW